MDDFPLELAIAVAARVHKDDLRALVAVCRGFQRQFEPALYRRVVLSRLTSVRGFTQALRANNAQRADYPLAITVFTNVMPDATVEDYEDLLLACRGLRYATFAALVPNSQVVQRLLQVQEQHRPDTRLLFPTYIHSDKCLYSNVIEGRARVGSLWVYLAAPFSPIAGVYRPSSAPEAPLPQFQPRLRVVRMRCINGDIGCPQLLSPAFATAVCIDIAIPAEEMVPWLTTKLHSVQALRLELPVSLPVMSQLIAHMPHIKSVTVCASVENLPAWVTLPPFGSKLEVLVISHGHDSYLDAFERLCPMLPWPVSCKLKLAFQSILALAELSQVCATLNQHCSQLGTLVIPYIVDADTLLPTSLRCLQAQGIKEEALRRLPNLHTLIVTQGGVTRATAIMDMLAALPTVRCCILMQSLLPIAQINRLSQLLVKRYTSSTASVPAVMVQNVDASISLSRQWACFGPGFGSRQMSFLDATQGEAILRNISIRMQTPEQFY
ncbi:hypothetical protein RI367_004872 [Sorochytrium milnesiophthora]